MRPEEIGSREARIVLSAEEIERLGALALEAGREELGRALNGVHSQMQEYEEQGVPKIIKPIPQKPVTARDIVGDEAMDKLERQWVARNAAAAKGKMARARRRRMRFK